MTCVGKRKEKVIRHGRAKEDRGEKYETTGDKPGQTIEKEDASQYELESTTSHTVKNKFTLFTRVDLDYRGFGNCF